ncbi:MAG: hypothetical protein RSG59_04590 [Ruthenibacterium sp.]
MQMQQKMKNEAEPSAVSATGAAGATAQTVTQTTDAAAGAAAQSADAAAQTPGAAAQSAGAAAQTTGAAAQTADAAAAVETTALAAACGFAVLVPGDTREITGVYTGDLLSWAMGRAKEGDAWCTVMGNVNTIAVATLADCACVVLCHSAVPDDAMRERAAQQGVAVFTTSLPEFEASLAVARVMGLVK